MPSVLSAQTIPVGASGSAGPFTIPIPPNATLRGVSAQVGTGGSTIAHVTLKLAWGTGGGAIVIPLADGWTRTDATTVFEGVSWFGALQTLPDVSGTFLVVVISNAISNSVFVAWNVELP